MQNKSIWTIGEPLCEIMRPKPGMTMKDPAVFMGPYPSGAPAIFADAVARLGGRSGFIGTVGNDDFGKAITERLEKDGVDCSGVAVSNSLSTGVAFVAYDNDGERSFIYHIGNAAAGELSAPKKLPENMGILHVMGCALLPSPQMNEAVKKMAQQSYASGAKITFDPNIRVESLREQNLHDLTDPIMEICSVFLPGVDELLDVSGCDSVEAAVKQLFKNPVLEVIALKRGSKGCTVYSRNEAFDFPVYPVKAKDATGAGDSFDAGFATAYLQGKPLVECARIASATAALNTAAFGPMEGDISKKSVQAMINSYATEPVKHP